MITQVLIILPVVASMLILFAGNSYAKRVALGAALLELGVVLFGLVRLPFASGGIADAVDLPWIASLGIRAYAGLDGINIIPVLLTALLMPLIVFSGKADHSKASWFYGLMMLMQAALMGVFTAFDGFLFYVFWELALIPIYFICLGWGADGRERITLKFFVYTIAGSLLMLAALIYLYLNTPGSHSFAWNDLVNAGKSLPRDEQHLVFWGLFLAFAVKIPVFPFHTWQPDTYTNAPVQGTMLLSGIMLKMGLYGLIRWLIPIVPDGVEANREMAILLCIIGIVYASSIAWVQKDFKRLLAFSSIAHVGLIAAGIFALNSRGHQGALIQMLAHGVNVVGLFYIAQLFEERCGTRDLSKLGGIRSSSTEFATLFMIIMLGSVALPLTNGFVGEFMLLSSVYSYNAWMASFAGLTIILGALYMLSAYQKSMLGELSPAGHAFGLIGNRERLVLIPVAALVLVFGVFPAPLLNLCAPAVDQILQLSTSITGLTLN